MTQKFGLESGIATGVLDRVRSLRMTKKLLTFRPLRVLRAGLCVAVFLFEANGGNLSCKLDIEFGNCRTAIQTLGLAAAAFCLVVGSGDFLAS